MVTATTLAACGGGGGGGESGQNADDAVTIALNADAAPGGYDPLLYAQGQFQFFAALYDSLFVTQADGTVEPSLVTEFSNSADNTQTTLTLRDESPSPTARRWTPSWSRPTSTAGPTPLSRRTAPSAPARPPRSPTSVSDPQTVVITWAAPQATPEVNLADTAGVVVGPDGVADPGSLETTPDGSGAYASTRTGRRAPAPTRWSRTTRRGTPTRGPSTRSSST